MKIKKIKKVSSERVYDITVDNNPNYVLENGVITHNSGLKYSASTILFLTKKKDRDGTDIKGNIITVTAVKSRFTKQYMKAEAKLSYDTGLDRYYGLLDLGAKYDIFKKAAKGWEMPDGSKHSEKKIYADPERFFTEDIMIRLEDAAKKEFKYSNTLEEDEKTVNEIRENDPIESN